jgi:hypothetical protein
MPTAYEVLEGGGDPRAGIDVSKKKEPIIPEGMERWMFQPVA